MVRIIGITGGIGSGKSTVCHILAQRGYPVYDTDREAKRLMRTDTNIIEKIKTLFGNQAYNSTYELNSKHIAQQVFGNNVLLRRLNDIVHPAVKSDLLQWAGTQTAEYVFAESAILFESGFNEICYSTIGVIAPMQTRIDRVMNRNGISRQQVVERINNQLSDLQLTQLADFVIHNDGDINYLGTEIDRIIHKITDNN